MKDTQLCSVLNCQRPRPIHKKTGKFIIKMCWMHYFRVYRNGNSGPVERLIAMRGEGNIQPNGYRRFGVNNKDYYEHRLVWEREYGAIPTNYAIHHLDGNKLNNDLSNLQCLSFSEHRKLHMELAHARQ